MLTKEIAQYLGAKHWGDNIEVTAMRSLSKANSQNISAIIYPKDLIKARSSSSGCLLISTATAINDANLFSCTLIVVDDLLNALKKTLTLLDPNKRNNFNTGIDSRASINENAKIDKSAIIFPFVYIGQSKIGSGTKIYPHTFIDDDVTIGNDCMIYPGCVILSGTKIGNQVILKSGSIVGSDGFVHFIKDQQNYKMPMIAGVVIEDEVEVGANSCIDKGMLENTKIRFNAKIDNLVQIGHDVEIGRSAALVAQSGVSGFCEIGDLVSIGGQAGIGPSVQIGSEAQVSSATHVFHHVKSQAIVSGSPAMPHMTYLRASAASRKLYKYQKEIKILQQKIQQLEVTTKNVQNRTKPAA